VSIYSESYQVVERSSLGCKECIWRKKNKLKLMIKSKQIKYLGFFNYFGWRTGGEMNFCRVSFKMPFILSNLSLVARGRTISFK